MSEGLRLFLQYASNILIAGFVVLVGAYQLSIYAIDRKVRNIFAAVAWFLLVPVFVLRTAGVPDPPRLDPQLIADGTAIGWALSVLLGICWIALRLWDAHKEAKARERLSASVESEVES